MQIHQCESKGDILLFLTGEEEIEDVCRRVRTEAESLGPEFGPIAVYPLYSSLPPKQQQDIFKEAPAPRQPGGPPGRKVCVNIRVRVRDRIRVRVKYSLTPNTNTKPEP
jgi:pre-mRNA-splicing factor ATP-dependent RNA helicase DHX15/PRP43